ncbi:MAG TPA: hypothetical protein VGH79_00290 [Gaiellaceae bacterium]
MTALKRVALVAVVAGAALLSATVASAGHHPARLRLGLVPLQTAQLGAAGASLALAYGSGSIGSDGFPTNGSGGVIIIGPGGDGTHGLVGGYVLDYGDPLTGSTGVTEIRTSVDEYKTPAEARKGLAAARFADRFAGDIFGAAGVTVTVKKVKPARVGQQRFGYRITQAAENLNPIVRLDEHVVAGRFLLGLTVAAGSASAANAIAPHLLRVLHHRLQLLLGGHATGKPPKLPPEPADGQAPGGPDLSGMVLQPSDVGMSHAVNLFQAYTPMPPALSGFFMLLSPAGTYDSLQQQIGWWPTATEATYGETYGSGNSFAFGFFGFGSSGSPVDLSGVGDNAVGYLDTGSGGSSVDITLTNGQAGEHITASSDATLTASDVQSLAQAAANRLDAGLGP